MSISIDKDWTLFLDRDGVINKRLPNDYVKKVDQFVFIDGVLESIAILSKLFNRIVVVSNQQGIGKGLMTISELDQIHEELCQKVKQSGGKIDKIYYSPYLHSERHISRKPMVGMGVLAKKEFKDISFRRSFMVGDSFSDMLFGKRLGMKTVFIGDPKETRANYKIFDFCFPNLQEFTKYVETKNEE